MSMVLVSRLSSSPQTEIAPLGHEYGEWTVVRQENGNSYERRTCARDAAHYEERTVAVETEQNNQNQQQKKDDNLGKSGKNVGNGAQDKAKQVKDQVDQVKKGADNAITGRKESGQGKAMTQNKQQDLVKKIQNAYKIREQQAQQEQQDNQGKQSAVEKNDQDTGDRQPAHTHTPGEPVRKDEIPADCTTVGSYTSVVYCRDCGEIIFRETVTIQALGHTGGEATCQTKAHCTRCGLEYGDYASHVFSEMPDKCTVTATCSVCGLTFTGPHGATEARRGRTWTEKSGSTTKEFHETEYVCRICGEVLKTEKSSSGNSGIFMKSIKDYGLRK